MPLTLIFEHRGRLTATDRCGLTTARWFSEKSQRRRLRTMYAQRLVHFGRAVLRSEKLIEAVTIGARTLPPD